MDELQREQDLQRLAWVERLDPMCMTLIEGVDEDEVIRRFGGDPGETFALDVPGYWDLQPEGYQQLQAIVGVGTAGGVVFAIEENGYTGNVPGVLRSLSREGRCLCVYTHVNAADNLTYAVGGELVVSEEPWGEPTPLRAGDSRWDPAWVRGLTDVEAEVWLRGARLFLAAERVMGVRIESAWFTEPIRCARIPDPDRYAGTSAWQLFPPPDDQEPSA
ncbi:hypothetical protein KGA66_14570 [Actinocrinis puniceicyclus]|uniref:Uncharacterized protein n=1 Tax=Actinocrinis puniceicyclus TaxID=977794 RepID=A0A8J8BDL3_9ACTN|nr:DUF6461 domain-containing protein [Actinocrinis puniceicyclus]MBS2964281.1 hypothetical protein [Actinocrinis puniceicyclus]